ncbi:MAG: type IX secretion system sortase PorU [Chryseolinea sp.]
MRFRLFFALFFSGCIAQASLCQGQSSVLASGRWYKVGVAKRGVYKLTYDQFRKMGFDPASTDPSKIQMFGNAGGMLAQPNSAPRPVDLQETAIFISGQSDGSFDKNDYILFFAEGADDVAFDISRNVFSYQSNLYSNKNFYFITVSQQNGKRVAELQSVAGSYPVIDTFEDYVYHENDEHNELASGREWFGERYDMIDTYAYRFDIAGIMNNSDLRLVSDVMAQSFNGSSFKISFNRNAVGEQVVPTIVNTQYSIKGRHRRDTITFDAATVGAPGSLNQEILYEYKKSSAGRNIGFLDFLLLNFTRALALYGDQTLFRSPSSLNQNISTYRVQNVPPNSMVWDITDPAAIALQSFTQQGDQASFSVVGGDLKEFVIFNANIPSPELVSEVPNQDLRAATPRETIIVSHPSFLEEAQRLAAHRQSHSNLSAIVVTPEEIYNEFSSGRQDVSAIRDFIRSMYAKDPGRLKVVLILGKGSYDYKDRLPNNTNFVPTYESRNSLSPLETYSSDDYFAFMEENEGNWGENPLQNHTLDIGVGRLPVKTAAEAKDVVDKIIDYDTNKKSYGAWRRDIVFVADDGSTSDGFSSSHQSQANVMANSIEALNPSFNAKRIFLGTYSKTVIPNGEVIPEANKAIRSWFNRGSLIVNYTGHGSEKLLADEKVFTETDIESLKNEFYPFLITATCEFGRQDDPAVTSSAELSVLHANGGSIGLVTSARPVNSPTNFLLNQQFYTSLFMKAAGKYRPVGEVFKDTKNNSMSGVANRNFSLIADPSMTLALPDDHIAITSLKTATGSDTLRALSTITVKGEIHDETGNKAADFNGTLEATLFDKASDAVTIGKNDPPFKFTERTNALYRGKATLSDGSFEFQFIVPKNIAYEFGKGKLSLYASDASTGRDAGGSEDSFIIGGSEKEILPDITPPTMKLYMGDTTFQNGGVVLPNTTLLVKLEDLSGINISTYGIGNAMVAVLDDDVATFGLSDYFQSQTDDFSRGWIHFPLEELVPGRHSITVKAWDTYNNPAQSTIEFLVTDGQVLLIESFGNAPNPFENETTIFFTHNRSGDDLQAILYLYSATGLELKTYQFDIPDSPYQVDLHEMNGFNDFGKKLPPGVYLARVAVRSLSNGSKSERVTKLIVVN